MIIIKVWGGIGNQLFQYVFGQYLRYKYGQEVYYDDNSYISTDKLRKKELDALDADIQYNNECEFSRYRGIKNRFMRFLFQINPIHHYIQEGMKSPEKFKSNHIYFFQGYWQDIKYYEWLKNNVPSFTIHANHIPEELSNLYNEIKSNDNSISIHVRRGDYFLPENVKTYGVCDSSYFERAMASMDTFAPGAKLYIFSDDPTWVKNNIKLDSDSTFVPNYPISQFAYIELMSLCKYHIISNSSFSWWAAVINEQVDSKTICPAKWTLTSDSTIALEKWVKL